MSVSISLVLTMKCQSLDRQMTKTAALVYFTIKQSYPVFDSRS